MREEIPGFVEFMERGASASATIRALVARFGRDETRGIAIDFLSWLCGQKRMNKFYALRINTDHERARNLRDAIRSGNVLSGLVTISENKIEFRPDLSPAEQSEVREILEFADKGYRPRLMVTYR
jgi:hypothetical protein